MRISILTLYPDHVSAFINRGVIGRYIESTQLSIESVSLRQFADPPHYKVDDYPFSNRKGMLLRYDVLQKALPTSGDVPIIMPDPSGVRFDYTHAKALAAYDDLFFISPAYEGVDARIIDAYNIQRFSMGDFIVTNGDAPIALMIDAIVRYLPGVLGSEACLEDDSILSGLLECPQYCHDRSIDQMAVPEVLLSGHHQEIERWKLTESIRRTLYSRPDLLNRFSFSESFVKIVDQIMLEDTK